MADYERLLALAQSDPEKFRRLMAAQAKKVVYPHPGQVPIIESKARFRVVNAGRRFGKTKIASKILLQHARSPDKMLWWVAPTYRIAKRGYEEILRQLPDNALARPAAPASNFDVGRPGLLYFKNGTQMEFYSAERPEGMLGAAVNFVVLDEAARLKESIWNETISPTLADHLGGALMISTPRGRNWFYRAWRIGQDPEADDWNSWTFTMRDNPTLPPGEPDRFKKMLPRLEYEQEIEAKFLAAGSSTFYITDRVIQRDPVHESGYVHGVKPEGHVVVGVDLARTNDYTVIYGARAKDRRNCYFERLHDVTWPEQKRRIKRAVKKLYDAGAQTVTLIIDETGVGDPIVEDLEASGYDVVGVNFTTHKNNMVRLLAKDLELGQAYVLEDGMMAEFESYTMTQSEATGKFKYSAPEGEHDDAVSAKMLQHHGLVNEGAPGVTSLDPTGEEIDERNPWEIPDKEDPDFSDLVDEEDDPGMSMQEAAVAIGFADARKPPTPQELLLNPDVWM